MSNKELIEKYPFLKLNCDDEYEFTWLDDLEPGWKKAFGLDFCKELDEAIKKDDCEDSFEFLQIKEKFAELRIYYTGGGPEVEKVITKYEELSKYICGHCGKYATKITDIWIYPLCDNCVKNVHGEYRDIEQFYHFKDYNEVLKEIEEIKTKL